MSENDPVPADRRGASLRKIEDPRKDNLLPMPHDLESMLRKVVRQEIENLVQRPSPSQTSQAATSRGRALQLCFMNQLPPTLFTSSTIAAVDGEPLRIALCDARNQNCIVTEGPVSSINIEICVLDGDFGSNGSDDWTAEEFKANIARERDGKRPLLTGQRLIRLEQGVGSVAEMTFTDNSSWRRSRKFRLGARVAEPTSHFEVIIREGKTEPFIVKDHRGELYKKHHPPSLNDEIWRLEKIARYGKIQNRLSSHGIGTVKDLLQLYTTNPSLLKQIIGSISVKSWETIIEHAKACDINDKKRYIYPIGLVFNCIYEVVGVTFDGRHYFALESLITLGLKRLVERVKQHAYRNLKALIPVDDETSLRQLQEGTWSTFCQPWASTSNISEAVQPFMTGQGFSMIEKSNKAIRNSKWNILRNLFKAILAMKANKLHQRRLIHEMLEPTTVQENIMPVNVPGQVEQDTDSNDVYPLSTLALPMFTGESIQEIWHPSMTPTFEGSFELHIPKNNEKSGQPSSSMDYELNESKVSFWEHAAYYEDKYVRLCDVTEQCQLLTAKEGSSMMDKPNKAVQISKWSIVRNVFKAIFAFREKKSYQRQLIDKMLEPASGPGNIMCVYDPEPAEVWGESSPEIEDPLEKLIIEENKEANLREGKSDPFTVKDHRGESYQKHLLLRPSLNDEIWRLEKIPKDGIIHKRLSSHGIETVKDLLQLYTTNPSLLKQIIGSIPRKSWAKIIEHAKACDIDDKKRYIYPIGLVFNCIYEVVGVTFDGRHYFALGFLITLGLKRLVERVKQHAYGNLKALIPVDDETSLQQLQEGRWPTFVEPSAEGPFMTSQRLSISKWRLISIIFKAIFGMRNQRRHTQKMLEPATDRGNVMPVNVARQIEESTAKRDSSELFKTKNSDSSNVHPLSTTVAVPISLAKSMQQTGYPSKPSTSEGSLELIIPKNHEKSGQPSSSMGERKQPFVFRPMLTMPAVQLSQEERPNKKLKMSQGKLSTMQVNILGRVENSNVPMAKEDLLLISHCFLFPFGYEFAREELVRLWIAEGLFQSNQNQRDRVEDVANDKFDSLVSQEIIVPSRNDRILDFRDPEVRKLLYKLHESKVSFFEHAAYSEDKYVRVCDGKFNHLSEKVLHLSVLCKNVNDMAFESIRRLKNLRTLFFIAGFGPSIERLPRNLFSGLKQLRALNFSRSRMSELPSSIGNLKALEYIDLSYTPIKQLPDSIDTLQSLQTLKLEGCFNLIGLPNGMCKLRNLRHLDLDVIGQLKSMPPKMGSLTNLQTLSAFLVGKDDGHKIGELKNAINLTGSFCISRLENVSNWEEAREADLTNKKLLNTLELRWWNNKRVNSSDEEEILEYLQPPLGLRELRILNYGGFKLPTWICDQSYECLVDLCLYNCTNCQFLPAMGELPKLQFLHIKEMNKLGRIDDQFYRDISDHNKDHHSFPSLKTLTFEDMPELEEWTGIQSGDFPSLQKLQVKYCLKLKSLPSLSFFNSLKHLEMSYCPHMQFFVDNKDDVRLEFLLIKDCPELKKLCKWPEGQDWAKIAHVPNIFIDDEEISCP